MNDYMHDLRFYIQVEIGQMLCLSAMTTGRINAIVLLAAGWAAP